MAGIWKNFIQRVSSFVFGGPRKLPPHVRSQAAPRKHSQEFSRSVSRETPPDKYVEKLRQLTDTQDQIREIEATMFDESLPVDIRKAALEEYANVTGWYRPENNDAWSSEEWRRWEQIYESEPEVF